MPGSNEKNLTEPGGKETEIRKFKRNKVKKFVSEMKKGAENNLLILW